MVRGPRKMWLTVAVLGSLTGAEALKSPPFLAAASVRTVTSLPTRAPVYSVRMVSPIPAGTLAKPLLPRALLLAVAIGYGTNFPVCRLMIESVPASAVTAGRFALAALVLSPFLPRLDRSLMRPALLCGVADCVGYIAQSVALVDTPAAKVAFLGALTVIWVLALDGFFNGRDLRPQQAPQVWLAASLTLLGVAFLELGPHPGAVLATGVHAGDMWAAVQALGFGTSFWIVERMMGASAGAEQSRGGERAGGGSGQPAASGDGAGSLHTQALPITAVNVGVVAALSAVWAVCDGQGLGPFASSPDAGWMRDPILRSQFALPGLATGPVGAALLWTGMITTALTRVGETVALGSIAAADAAVVVATEPVWAAAFGVMLCGESLRGTDILGGLLLVAACVASSLSKEEFDSRMLWLFPPAPSTPSAKQE